MYDLSIRQVDPKFDKAGASRNDTNNLIISGGSPPKNGPMLSIPLARLSLARERVTHRVEEGICVPFEEVLRLLAFEGMFLDDDIAVAFLP